MLFEKQEYKERLKKVKIDMQKKGIDLLVSHDPANMNYLTGYDAWSFYYAQCVLVHLNEDEPICFVRAQDGGGAYIKTYLKNENIIEYDEKYIHTWPLHPYQYLVEIIKKRKWDNLNIGLEMDSHYFTAYCYETIKKGLPNAKFKDAERLVNWVRVVKSNKEIKLMQSAARIVESGMKTAFKSINPDIRQCVSGINIVGGVSGISYKSDSGWNDNLTRIAEAHPQSNLAKNQLRRSTKQVKTENVLKKHRKRNRW